MEAAKRRKGVKSTMYEMCKKLINAGLVTNLQAKLNAFLAADQLTVDEYSELASMLKG